MTVIELSDEQAAALAAKAAAEGLSLKAWLEKQADTPETGPAHAPQSVDDQPIWEVIQDIMRNVPDDVFERLPKDGASQVDHYIYRLPKRH